jgi:hypothetical protein
MSRKLLAPKIPDHKPEIIFQTTLERGPEYPWFDLAGTRKKAGC